MVKFNPLSNNQAQNNSSLYVKLGGGVDVTVGSAVIVRWACSNKLISDGYALFQFGSIFSFVKVGTWFMCWKTFFAVGIQLQTISPDWVQNWFSTGWQTREEKEENWPSQAQDAVQQTICQCCSWIWKEKGAPTQMLPDHTIYLLLLYNWSQINNICLLDNFVVRSLTCVIYIADISHDHWLPMATLHTSCRYLLNVCVRVI